MHVADRQMAKQRFVNALKTTSETRTNLVDRSALPMETVKSPWLALTIAARIHALAYVAGMQNVP